MAWTDLEHSVWKVLKDAGLEQRSGYFLAVSGGADSTALLQIFNRIKPGAHLKVAYYHHGPSSDQTQQVYRDKCLTFLENYCNAKANINFVSGRSDSELQTEAAMRSARWSFLREHSLPNEPIITAHHLDDWIETLTLKLIRGVGPEAFTAFKIWDGLILRPLLETTKDNIVAYSRMQNIKWCDDPSNNSDHHLRNWLRLKWFKLLDEKNPSGYENYSRSLLRLCQALDQNQTFALQFFRNSPELGLDRLWYFSLTDQLQLKALALFLRHHSISNVTTGHLAEIQKRLDKNQKDITFTLAHVKWVINEVQIVVVLKS